MKKMFVFLFAVVLVETSFATIWLVDNNQNSPSQYKNVQDVINNHAASGDTIMVEGSPFSYGDISVTKPLVLIGEGYDDTQGENTMAGQIWIQSSNVVVTGFHITINLNFDATSVPAHQLVNVLVDRCFSNTGYWFHGGPSATSYLMRNIRIRNNIASYGFSVSQNNNRDLIQFDSLIIENNIVNTPHFSNWGGNITGAHTIVLRNNLCLFSNGSNNNTLFYNTYNGTSFHDAIIYNNIFFASNPTGSSNCTFMNNLTYGNGSGLFAPIQTGSNDTLPGPVNNNIYSQNPQFVNFDPAQLFPHRPDSYSNSDFHTKPGSPCNGTGVGGTDIGIYGGLYPFKTGPGQIPVVDLLNISNSAVPNGSKFYLEFKARARQ